MLKSKIRKKILKIRENKNKGKIHIKFSKIYSLLKKKTSLRKKIIGGYFKKICEKKNKNFFASD